MLRLASDDDDGIRGTLALDLNAKTEEPDGTWALRGAAQLGELHRWDLASRSDNPSLSLIAQARWNSATSFLEFSDAALEAPHSNLHAAGRISWVIPARLRRDLAPPVQIAVTSSQISLGDLLDWLRAFHSTSRTTSRRKGLSRFAAISTAGRCASRMRSARAKARNSPAGAFRFRPTWGVSTVSIRSRNHFRPARYAFFRRRQSWREHSFRRAAAAPSDGSFQLGVATKSARGALALLARCGKRPRHARPRVRSRCSGPEYLRGWDLGALFLRPPLESGTDVPWLVRPTGWIEFGDSDVADGAALHAPFLNQPIDQIHARADLKPGKQHITLTSARAFEANGAGRSIARTSSPSGSSSSRPDSLRADLDRWLNPLWRESFLDRMLPFLNPLLPAVAVPEALRASGRLSLDEFTLPPLAVHHLQADLKIGGRHIELANATGQLYGGTLAGSLVADLQAPPSYKVNAAFSRVDLSALSAASPSLANLFDGSADGKISFMRQRRYTPPTPSPRSDARDSRFRQPHDPWHRILYPRCALSACRSRCQPLLDGFGVLHLLVADDPGPEFVVRRPGPPTSPAPARSVSTAISILRLHFVPPAPKSAEPSYRITGSLASPKFCPHCPNQRRAR